MIEKTDNQKDECNKDIFDDITNTEDVNDINNMDSIKAIDEFEDINNINDIEMFDNIEIEFKEPSEQQLEFGKQYYDEDKYEEAFYCFMESAGYGNPVAQNCLGILYYEGQGVDKDDEKAIEWYTKAAEQGNKDATLNLADMYYYKEDASEEEAEKAFQHYEKLAEFGDNYVQNQLANCYATGFGVDTNVDKAIEMYEQLAKHGDAEAMFNLGMQYYCYKNDVNSAFAWLKKAADQGNACAIDCLGWLYLYGVGTEKNLDEAVDCFTVSEYRDLDYDIEDLLDLNPWGGMLKDDLFGILDLYGNIIPENIIFKQGEEYLKKEEYTKAVKYLNLINCNYYLSAKSNYLLAICYENGWGVDAIDRDYALSLYKEVAIYSTYMAMKLGDMFLQGQGVEKDYEEAIGFYDYIGEPGQLSIYVRLAERYYYGIGVDRDYEKAIEWYEKAVNLWPDPSIIMRQAPINEHKASKQVPIDKYIRNIGNIIKIDKYTELNPKPIYAYICNRSSITRRDKYIIDGGINFEKNQYIYAQKTLGDMYYNGDGVYRNSAEGIKHYEALAELGAVDIAKKLVAIYFYGTAIEQDYKKAFYWWTKMDQADSIDTDILSKLYEKAVYWWSKLDNADSMNYDILINLAETFLYGQHGVEQDYEKAAKCFEMIDADKASGEIQNRLAKYYEKKDEKIALELYEKAAVQRCKEAMANLGNLYYKKGEYAVALVHYKKAFELYKLSVDLYYYLYFRPEINLKFKDETEKYDRLKRLIEKTEKKITSNKE